MESFASSRLHQKEENIDFENFIYCPVSFESFFDNSLDNLDIKNINSFIETAKINHGSPIWFESNKIGHERYVYCTKDSSLVFLIGVFRKIQAPAAPHPGQALLGAAELLINPLRNPSVMLYDRRQL